MTLNNVVAGLIAVLCTVALPAAAQTETVTFTGTIVAGYGMDTIGLFGGGDLSNDAFSLTYIFNFLAALKIRSSR